MSADTHAAITQAPNLNVNILQHPTPIQYANYFSLVPVHGGVVLEFRGLAPRVEITDSDGQVRLGTPEEIASALARAPFDQMPPHTAIFISLENAANLSQLLARLTHSLSTTDTGNPTAVASLAPLNPR